MGTNPNSLAKDAERGKCWERWSLERGITREGKGSLNWNTSLWSHPCSHQREPHSAGCSCSSWPCITHNKYSYVSLILWFNPAIWSPPNRCLTYSRYLINSCWQKNVQWYGLTMTAFSSNWGGGHTFSSGTCFIQNPRPGSQCESMLE